VIGARLRWRKAKHGRDYGAANFPANALHLMCSAGRRCVAMGNRSSAAFAIRFVDNSTGEVDSGAASASGYFGVPVRRNLHR
jgi:hypothetical protein